MLQQYDVLCALLSSLCNGAFSVAGVGDFCFSTLVDWHFVIWLLNGEICAYCYDLSFFRDISAVPSGEILVTSVILSLTPQLSRPNKFFVGCLI